MGDLRVLYDDQTILDMIPILIRDGVIDGNAKHVGGIVKWNTIEGNYLNESRAKHTHYWIERHVARDIDFEDDGEFVSILNDGYLSDV